MPLEGIPEGVEVVRYGTTDHPDEWALHNGKLHPGSGVVPCVVVKPAPGYEFLYDIRENVFRPMLHPVLMARPDPQAQDLHVTFHFTNSAVAQDVLAKLRQLPGFTGVWETHEGGKASRAGGV